MGRYGGVGGALDMKGPIELATSLAPCANESQMAVKIWMYLKTASVFGSNFSALSWIAVMTPSVSSFLTSCTSRLIE